jgi:hypothetical protein
MGETLRCRTVGYCDDDGPPGAVLSDRGDGKALRGITNRNRAFGADGQRSEGPVPVGQREQPSEGGARARGRARLLFD